VILWDVADPARPIRRATLTGHTDGVTSVAFTADGRTLATGSLDTTAILWDVADPARPRRLGDRLTGHANWVNSVAFSTDGRTLATSSEDNTVILWDIGIIGELRKLTHDAACQRVGTGLTEDEWDRYVSGIPYKQTC
jgi:WD40 repeat protein